MSYPTPIGEQLIEEYGCQDRDGPNGQRCQLILEHDPPHIAAIGGTIRGWLNGDEVDVLPPGLYRWAPSFPRDESEATQNEAPGYRLGRLSLMCWPVVGLRLRDQGRGGQSVADWSTKRSGRPPISCMKRRHMVRLTYLIW
jgi:hypothetical protein